MPHGLRIDADDNVWITDVGRHQVLKLTPEGRLLLAIGTERVAGEDGDHFSLPTDVAVLPDGSFYVSDGYGNARVAKFSPRGELLLEWGGRGSAPGRFDLPHSIVADGVGRIYVADRGNARVQVFDHAGTFVEQWSAPELGRPFGLALGGDGRLYVVDGGDQPPAPPDRSGVARIGADGRVDARFARFGNYDGQLMGGHAIAVAADGAVYVVDIAGRRAQKLIER
jgi:DNA-binding beta-propeller fold protein YncE